MLLFFIDAGERDRRRYAPRYERDFTRRRADARISRVTSQIDTIKERTIRRTITRAPRG